jgi:predicted transcriptional regulator
MQMSTEVPDGATQRHSRMMELLTFINLNEPHGATITHIQAHMLQVFGLKFRMTSEMTRELAMAGTIKVDGHGFYHLTEKQQVAMKTMLARALNSHRCEQGCLPKSFLWKTGPRFDYLKRQMLSTC